MRQTEERLQSEVFDRLFREAEIAKFTKVELKEYEDSLKAYRDIKNSLDTAEAKGRAEGMAEGIAVGIVKVARKLLTMGMTTDYVADATGLSKEEIKDIADKLEAADKG